MDLDFSEYFTEYEGLVIAADSIFDKIAKTYPKEVRCKLGCADCCHALFDLNLVESMYISKKFREKYEKEELEKMLERANTADRKIHKIKKQIADRLKSGESEDDLLESLAAVRVRCPLLNEKNQCDLYEARPVTCRLYGLPTSIGGKSHTCGISGFAEGKLYPTVKMDQIYGKLMDISMRMVQSIPTRYTGLADMMVPLSMALINIYDEDYLGIIENKGTENS